MITGLLYLDESAGNLHEMNQTPETVLSGLPYAKLCPGSVALAKLRDEFR